jgi:muramoyltetrapeptide carboxypeptidase
MRYPEKLKDRATIGLICSSSAVSEENVRRCVAFIEKLGYKAVAADNLATNYAGFLAGKGAVRGYWINKMFADSGIDAIFCVRGGDGAGRVMPHLDLDLIKRNPKIFVGYSDVTCLHLALNQICDLVTFHGPMVSSNMLDHFDMETSESLFSAISTEDAYEFRNPEGYPIFILKEGKAKGDLIGGNMSVLSASIGTFYEINTENKILFLEEVKEPVDRLDRLVCHLLNAGKFQRCAGIILGQFKDCPNKGQPDYGVIECFADLLEGLGVPVVYNVQSGHDYPMMTLPLGAMCAIDTSARSVISFGKPAR